MGSKKHKKESKKKKHRSRSRSPLDGEVRERKHKHKKHKDRKKDRSPDVEEVPVDSHLVERNGGSESSSPSHSASAERDRRMREHHADQFIRTYEIDESRAPSPVASSSRGGGESLSIEETNRIRVKLGLKPLQLTEKTADDGKITDDLGEFYHKPAANISEIQRSEKIRQKLEERKEKRKLEQKLKTTLLAESDGEDDISAWIERSRQMELQKKAAQQRAAMLDEMDAVFGVSALVEEDAKETRQESYTAKQLRGLRVAHDLDALGDERDVILTLADKDVLAEDSEDVLVNVNIVDDERYKKKLVDAKKARTGYKAYDDEADIEAEALGLHKSVLSKYDEEIDKGKEENEKGFVIGDEDAIEARRFREMMRRERMAGGVEKRLESLMMPEKKIASDYLDEREIEAKFKKVKKKGKFRKKSKAEPIDVDDYDAGNAPLETDDTDVKEEDFNNQPPVDEEEVEVDSELQAALASARRLRLAEKAAPVVPKVEEILEKVKEERPPSTEPVGDGAIVLDATAEFCRTLGDIPTYGQAGNRRTSAELMDWEKEDDMEVEAGGADGSEEPGGGAWSRVDVHSERPADLTKGAGAVLDVEPALGKGVGGALQLALSKGYLEKEQEGRGGTSTVNPKNAHLLAAQNYSIEDKTLGEEDNKYSRRERGYHGSGPLVEFREKSHFRPNVKLDYVDDEGHTLCPKEAFRYLSHKFHGKGPGKNKQEKRIKKQVQEGLMKKMSSTDTPLNTLHMLQEKQRETASPYIVLSGAKRDQNH